MNVETVAQDPSSPTQKQRMEDLHGRNFFFLLYKQRIRVTHTGAAMVSNHRTSPGHTCVCKQLFRP